MATKEKNRATIIVLSGDMDKVFAAYILASTAAAAGMDTTMFFTFWGLQAIMKGHKTGKTTKGKMIGGFLKGGLDKLNPSRLSFGGMGRKMFRQMMDAKNVTSIADLREACIDLGVHLLACQMSMDVMEIAREDLIDEVEDVVGAARAIKDASESSINYFI